MRGEQAPAGWYPVEDDKHRYWDGAAWTEQFADSTHGAVSHDQSSGPIETAQVSPQRPSPPSAGNTLGTLALSLGVLAVALGLVPFAATLIRGEYVEGLGPFLTMALGVVVTVLGVEARRRVHRGEATNRGTARAALLLGITAMVGAVLFIGFIFSDF